MPDDIMTNGNNKLILKESKMATSIHDDTGFCSGEDYIENEIHSPTDSSEDSVEVKVSTITFNKNKRKLVHTSPKEMVFTGPLKKRMCLKVKNEASDISNAPFRPWSPPQTKPQITNVPMVANNFAVPFPLKLERSSPCALPPDVAAFSYFRPPSPVNFPQQLEPVSLVIKREKDDASGTKQSDIRVPIHPQIAKLSAAETERMILKTNEHFPGLQTKIGAAPAPSTSTHAQSSSAKKAEQKREQRNYKNMTRERRIEANARERTRVHTISAAFDTLRQAVPSYSHNQKLSKLSVLRIACSYIMTLSSLVQDSDGDHQTSEYVDMVSRTIQREGKLRKKKDDND